MKVALWAEIRRLAEIEKLSGRLIARFYDEHGSFLGAVPIADVKPDEPVSLQSEVAPPGKAARVSLHLEDETGVDRGSLNEVQIRPGDHR